ncbi:MAG: nucleoside deaminase [Clostridia bacterium]|jgi:tRNA(Arg) A34 adenosine deaminase TadA|nr:nucleoside deaminase [Clostridia bacterium]MDD4572436.1 nucleoside deaminase [Clostridia bacterium]
MNTYMQMAIAQGMKNIVTGDGGPFGAVIVKDNNVVGIGRNMVFANNDPTSHAEIMAIRDACKNLAAYDLSGCVLYASCQPCYMCMGAIFWANIKEVYYSTTSIEAARFGCKGHLLEQEAITNFIYSGIKTECIDNEQGIALLATWQKKPHQIY